MIYYLTFDSTISSYWNYRSFFQFESENLLFSAISESGVDVPSGDEEEEAVMELGKESDSDWSPTTPRVNTKRRPRISAE